MAGRAFGGDHLGTAGLGRFDDVEHELRGHIAVRERMRTTAAGGFQRKLDILGAGGGEDIIHEMRLGGRLAAWALVLLGEDVARACVHTAVIVGDLDALERVLHALFELFLAHGLLDPVKRVDRLDLAGLIGIVAGLGADALVHLDRFRIIGEVVLGLLEVVIAAVAGRHDLVEAHILGDREVAGGKIGLHLGVNVLDLHRAAAVPVLKLHKLEAQGFAHCLGRAVIGVAGAF